MITPEQLEKLLQAHSAALQLYARQWSDSPDDPVQQAFIKLATMDPPPENPTAWLFRVVKNFAISQRRSQLRRRTREQNVATTEEYFYADVANKIDPAELTRAIDLLEPQTREVIVARIWGELNFEEIATLVDCSSSTAHRKFESGLNELRNSLGLTWLIKK